jgi:hypothetical protein
MQAADHCIASTIPQGVLVAHLRRGVNGTQTNRARNPFRRDRGRLESDYFASMATGNSKWWLSWTTTRMLIERPEPATQQPTT